MIPKIIHQIHLGGSELTDQEKTWQQTWSTYNPDWELKLWDEHAIEKLPIKNKPQLERCNNYSEMSDILRFEILYQYGGLYIDTDFECLKSITKLIQCTECTPKPELIIFNQGPKMLCGAFMASTKLNSDIKGLVDGVEEREKSHGHCRAHGKYGPVYLTDKLGMEAAYQLPADSGGSGYLVYAYKKTPKTEKQDNSHDCLKQRYPKSYAIHHWHGSWTT